jgi:hypothetical protein
MSAHLRLRLEERAGQRKAQDRAVTTLREGNRELIQKNARLETRIRELNDEDLSQPQLQDRQSGRHPHPVVACSG